MRKTLSKLNVKHWYTWFLWFWPMKLPLVNFFQMVSLCSDCELQVCHQRSLTEHLPSSHPPSLSAWDSYLFAWIWVVFCWRKLCWGGCGCWLTHELTQASRDSSPPHLWNAFFFTIMCFSQMQPERARSCWDHSDWIYYWTQLRPLIQQPRLDRCRRGLTKLKTAS